MHAPRGSEISFYDYMGKKENPALNVVDTISLIITIYSVQLC